MIKIIILYLLHACFKQMLSAFFKMLDLEVFRIVTCSSARYWCNAWFPISCSLAQRAGTSEIQAHVDRA